MTVVMEDEDFVVVKASDDRIRVDISDVAIQGPIILVSPNGTEYQIVVSDDGTLSTVMI